jgi:MFS family permease
MTTVDVDKPAADETVDSTPIETIRRDAFAALRFRDFRLLFIGRFIWQFGEQMLNAAVGWEIYERTGSALALGVVGLAQVLPVILLALPAGHVADRFNRKGIVIVMQIILALCGLALAAISFTQGSIVLFYLVLVLTGIGAAFHSPALAALTPATIEPAYFPNAATWSSNSWQLAAMIGPALAGFLIAAFKGAGWIYLFNALGCTLFILMLLLVRGREIERSSEPMTLRSMSAGLQFIRDTRIIFGAITLDMFAVLFGGAVALLPVFAKDILQVGPEGFGWLRAAPSIGAVVMAVFIASRVTFNNAGQTLLLAVAGFGVATIIFGLSTSFWLSVAMLFLLGALDNISVVIRSTLLLLRTPDEMRGRVSAVNSVFIGMSNELGSFESGVAAALLGPVGAVVFGGIGTLLVVTWVTWAFPQLRDLKQLS